MPTTPTDLAKQPGDMIEEFRIVRVLGTGAFGIVYQADNTYLPETVAIKEFLPRELAHRDPNGNVVPLAEQNRELFDWARGRFLEEARNLWQLAQEGPHPNIVRVTRYSEANGTAYMFMAFETGRPLSAILNEQGRITREQLDALFAPLLDGLERVHQNHIIHRDIKPDNILIRADGSPVLIDFGAARRVAAQTERSIVSTYTPVYAALEQQQAVGELGPWTDIYCLGATLYRAVTGVLPLGAPERLYGIEQRPAAELAGERFDPALLVAIDAGCAIRPEERPQSIAEWRQMLLKRGDVPAAEGPTRIVPHGGDPTAITSRGGDAQQVGAMPRDAGQGATTEIASQHTGTARPAAPPTTAGPVVAKPSGKGRLAWTAVGLGTLVVAAAMAGWAFRNEIVQRLPIVTMPPQVAPEDVPSDDTATATATATATPSPDPEPPARPQPSADAPQATGVARIGEDVPEISSDDRASAKPPASTGQPEPTSLASTADPEPDPGPEPDPPARERTLITAGSRFTDPLAEGGTGPIMVWLPAGTFQMGSPNDEPGRHPDERAFRAEVPQPVAVSETELTIGQFRRFVNSTDYRTEVDRSSTCLRPDDNWEQLVPDISLSWDLPGHPVDDRHPVACVSWNDAHAYTEWLSQQTGKPYRLPTELEWEYAARGQRDESRFWGNDPAAGCTHANTAECDDDHRFTAPAGTFPPNPFGLRSVLGNLAEWTCSDYGSGYFGNESHCGAGDAGNSVRVFRGGSWLDAPALVRAAARDAAPANLGLSTVGLRLLRELDPATERAGGSPARSAAAPAAIDPSDADAGPAAPRSTN